MSRVRTLAAMAAVAAVAAAVASRRPPSELTGAATGLGDGKPRRTGVDRDPGKLAPAFRARLERVFAALRARGFDPYLWEGYRAPARAEALAEKGVGIARSLHSMGTPQKPAAAAVDVVSESKLWGAPSAFWVALCEEAEREGLVSGRRFSRVDNPHVQAVAVRDQAALRAAADPAAFIAERFA